jgi:ribonuclease Z
MELTLLGTGCPAVSTERYGPAQVICHQNQAILVDCGSGVTQRLLAAGLSGRALDAVFLTHLHSDHIVDLFQLVISSWHQGRDRPQRIFGPWRSCMTAMGCPSLVAAARTCGYAT